MSPSYVAFLVTLFYPMLGAIIAIIIPHLIHATQLLADPWMQESWQFEAACSAVVVEHWFIPEAQVQVQTQPGRNPTRPQVNAARSPHPRPLPAFLVRRPTVTRQEMLYSMMQVMIAAHPQVIAEFNRELRVEAEALELQAALEHAIQCAKSGYSSTQMKKLAALVWRLPNIPIECAEEILAARPHWRNPRRVQAQLETALAYL